MTTKIVYVAEDGQEFENEDLCYEHEREVELEECRDHVFIYNSDGQMLDILERDVFYNAEIVICKTDYAARVIQKYFSDAYTPWDDHSTQTGQWLYYADADVWIDVEAFLKKADRLRKLLETV